MSCLVGKTEFRDVNNSTTLDFVNLEYKGQIVMEELQLVD